jgi:Rps23 Pro-64 3,4-dihydroxylase Tpa1-like proline 4-hydroxylase
MFKTLTATELQQLHQQFSETKTAPFPHVVIDGLLDDATARACATEFKEWTQTDLSQFVRYTDKDFEFEKYTLNKISEMPPQLAKVFAALHSDSFMRVMQQITGFADLRLDEKLWGGGLHMTKKGGYLACHKDFSVLPTSFESKKQLLRVVNIIGYFNPDWKPGDGGELELWENTGTRAEKKISPQFNRWVIFDTRDSFHGHPFPYQGETPRFSVAAYYYLEQTVEQKRWSSTSYLKLPWREDSPEYEQRRKDRASAELRYGLKK